MVASQFSLMPNFAPFHAFGSFSAIKRENKKNVGTCDKGILAETNCQEIIYLGKDDTVSSTELGVHPT